MDKSVKPSAPARPASYDKNVALVLQGGGALGAYQAGVYEALAQSEYLPDWVAGISIGAINAALIAGNAPEMRVARLREFWETVTRENIWPSDETRGPFEPILRVSAALSAIFFGERGFFTPRAPGVLLTGGRQNSYYDTSALRETLTRLVDFDLINSDEIRLSVGAVDVATGNFRYFDSREMRIGPEHVMASGALPPAFPPVEIDGACYWDGGLVSNTPLEYVLNYYPRRSRLAFQVDVFPAAGRQPQTIEQVMERISDIRFSSRTRKGVDTFRTLHDIRHNLMNLLDKLPQDLKHSPEAVFLDEIACVTRMDIAHLIYRPGEPQGWFKDYEFSRRTMRARWAQGLADAQATLAASPWLAPPPPEAGVRVFDVAAMKRRSKRVA